MTDDLAAPRPTKKPLLPRWLKTVLVFVGVLLFLAVGAWIVLDITTRQDLNAALAEIEALGWPLFLDELYPEPIPDEENAAVLYQQAYSLALWQPAEWELWEKWTSAGVLADLTAEEGATLSAYLQKRRSAFQVLRQAAELPECQFPLEYADGFNMVLNHLHEFRSLARLLRLATLVAADQGEGEVAFGYWLDAMAMVRHQEGQRVLISELVRIACLWISTETLEAMVQSGQLTDGQLAQADSALGDLNLRTGLADSLKGELVFARGIFTGSFADIKAIRGYYSGPSDPLELMFRLYSSPFGRPWRQHDQATYLMLLKEEIELAEQPYADVAKQHGAWERDLEETPRWQAPLTAMLLPALTRASQAAAGGEARRDMARTALAMERYRLKHDCYPESLTDLTPDLLPQVLMDPFDGQPVRYVKSDDRVLLYSVGADLQDDGGSEEKGTSGMPKDIVFTLRRPPEAVAEDTGDE